MTDENIDLNVPDTATEVESKAAATDTEKKSDTKVLFKERYEIDFSKPLPHLNNNDATAFGVSDRIDSARKLFALICSNDTCPRLSVLPYLKSIEHPALMKLLDFGTIFFPQDKTHKMALIYAMPLGGKVFENGVCTINFKNNYDKFKQTLLNILELIDVMKSMHITHRAIRTDNLYFSDENKSEIILGDCAASFPAFHQPPVFETIESIYADKDARGNGNDKNDVYSAAVTALCLFLGHDLAINLSGPEILRQKIKKGSFSFFNALEKIPTEFFTVFRGLLQDVSSFRWGHTQVANVFDGKQVNLNSPASLERPKRALNIKGEKVYMPHDVVYTMQLYPDEAYSLIMQGKIADWAKNGLENEKLTAQIESIVKQEQASAGNKDLTIAKISILIDKLFPIRYKNITFFPDGVAKAVFSAVKAKKSIKEFIEIFSSDLIKLWYQDQEYLRTPSNFTEFRVYIMRQEIGYGIERIIYDLDADIPCISPLFEKEFVSSAPQVLKALDAAFDQTNIMAQPYDRMIVAFLRCKMGKKIDEFISGLNSNRNEVKASSILQLYAMMQTKFGPTKLVNLAHWLANFAKPMIQIYHNKKYQRYLEKELLKTYPAGKIYEIYNLLENEQTLEKDRNDFATVLNEVNLLNLEKSKISGNSAKLEESAKAAALKLASIFAVLAMTVSFAYNLIKWVLQ